MRLSPLWLALACALPTPSCCSLARFWCGPDRTPWISVDYSTPEAAARTLLEALRRDDAEAVYKVMSAGCRRQHGLDYTTTIFGWPQFRDANPGLHVAGYAEVPPALVLGPDRARVELTIEGRRVDLELVRERRWEVRFPLASGAMARKGETVRSFAGIATATPHITDEDSKVALALQLPPVRAHELPLEQVQFAGIYSEWKVDGFTVLAPQ
jgi:hypothetical protein